MAGIPATGISAVTVNMTAVNPANAGIIYADKAGVTPSTAVSYMNYTAKTSSTSAIIPVGANGKIQLRSSQTTNFTVDVQGYYTAGPTSAGGFAPVDAQIVASTQTGAGGVAKAKVNNTGVITFAAAGVAGVPTTASSVVLSVTESAPATTGGSLYAYPAGASKGSNALSWTAGANYTWSTPVAVSKTGQVSIQVATGGPVNIDVAVEGYFTPTSSTSKNGQFSPAATRVYDSGTGTTAVPLAAGATRTVKVAGVNGLPLMSDGINSIAAGLTIAAATAAGHLDAYASGAPANSSGVQFYAATNITSFMVVPLGSDGSITIRNSSKGTIRFIVDVQGYYFGAVTKPQTPLVLDTSNLTTYTDAAGRAATVLSDDHGAEERHISVQNADGSASSVSAYYRQTNASYDLQDIAATEDDALANGVDGSTELVNAETDDGAAAPVDPATLHISFAMAVSASTISLSWVAQPDVTSYSVQRDGVELGTVTSNHFEDPTLDPSTRYNYVVDPIVSADKMDQTIADSFTFPAETLPAISSANLTQSSARSLSTASRYQQGSTEFAYQTFIPQARVSGGLVDLCTAALDISFGGDDTGYVSPEAYGQYRTLMYAAVLWNQGKFQYFKHVNPTHEYRGNKIIKTKTAPSSGLKFKDARFSSAAGAAHIQFDHSAGNPHCKFGAIQYNVTIDFFRTGVIIVRGHARPVPNHAGWVRWSNDIKWQNVFKMDNKGFLCLTGGCGTLPVGGIFRD